jgi:small-conductance mechanosensitive channel
MENILENFGEPILNLIPKLPGAIITLVFGYLFLRIVQRLIIGGLKVSGVQKTVQQILMSFLNVLLWAILLALIFQSLGLTNVALALSGSVAIVALIIGSGVNAILGDVLSGLFLSRDPDFRVGYLVKTNDTEGIVEKIDLRKVRIRDNNGKIHVFPTSMFDKAPWTVLDENKK